MGRPREYDRDAIAQSILEWAQKETSINLNGFCTTHDPLIPPSYLSIWANEDDEFSKAYETAKAFLACRRENKLANNELHVKAYDLNAGVYDYFLREEKRREKEFESELKKNENDSKPEKITFEVNYTNDSNNPIKISSQELPDQCDEVSQ